MQSLLERFHAVFAELNQLRWWFESSKIFRYAALAAVHCAGEPKPLAKEIHEHAGRLRRLAGWFGDLRSELRYVIAAVLVLYDDEPEAFHRAFKNTRSLFRAAGVRRDSTYELLSVVVLRTGLGLREIDAELVERMHAIFREMQRYEWWLTSAEDLPACAMLALQPEPVGLILQELDQIYGGMHTEGFSRGDELQSSAHLLYLAKGRAELSVSRAGELLRAFKSQRVTIRRGDYDEIALLAFLTVKPEALVAQVIQYRDEIRKTRPRVDMRAALNIAANLVFMDCVRADDELLQISEIKLIVDLQAMVAAQRAAAAVAAAS
ncbi:MAG: DUF4003 family protein [Phycisphaerae bacterium]